MKKLFAIVLILSLMLCTLPVMAEGYDEALDAAFEAGRVAFTQAGFLLPDLATCEIVEPPDDLWQFAGIEPMDDAQIRAVLAQAELAVFSYAPDGQSGIGMMVVGEGVLPFAMSPDRLAVIWPREDRGVQDSYDLMDKVYHRFYFGQDPGARHFGMGEEGAVWSPTGRYCCVLNSTRVLQEMHIEFGAPFIIDTQTGELFALDAFNPKLMSEDSGCWIGGCFSRDDSAFYAMTFANRYEDRYTLVRYDLETCEAAPCAGFAVNSLPAMTMLADGNIFALLDSWKRDDPQMLASIAPDGSVVTREMLLKGDIWRFRAVSACCSAESGWALLRGTFILDDNLGGYLGLQRLRAADGFAEGAETLWMLSADTHQFEALDKSQLPDTQKEWAMQFMSQHMRILDVKLSPDGRYAAVFAAGVGARRDESALLIVRLEDMAVLPAQGIDMGNTDPWVQGMTSGQHLMSWSEAGLLLSTNGLWQLEAQD